MVVNSIQSLGIMVGFPRGLPVIEPPGRIGIWCLQRVAKVLSGGTPSVQAFSRLIVGHVSFGRSGRIHTCKGKQQLAFIAGISGIQDTGGKEKDDQEEEEEEEKGRRKRQKKKTTST